LEKSEVFKLAPIETENQ